jgi:exopolysaccharide biosynthesis polyprenyl glycosylphosphotransferase
MNDRHLPERPSIEPRWLFPLLDAFLVLVAFVLGYFLRYEWQIFRPVFDPRQSGLSPYLPFAIFYAALLYFTYSNNNLYRNVRGRSWSEEVAIIVGGVGTSTVILLAFYFILRPEVTSRLMLIYVAALTVILQSGLRVVRRMVLAYLRGKGIGVQRVLIIGMGETGQAVLGVMISRQELDYSVVGYLDDDPLRGEVDLGRVPGLGNIENLRASIKEREVDLVVITLGWKHYDRIQEIAAICRERNVDVRMVPDIFQMNLRQVQVENLDGIPLLGINGTVPFRGAGRLVKRVLDVALVILAAPLWLTIMGLVALAIKLEGDGPIFYMTRRVGENGREFNMFKFRSMIPNADALRDEVIQQSGEDPRHPKPINDSRITRIGKHLRRTSIDELPNLFNVLRGEMSLVGPRPPLPSEVALYEPRHLRRLQIMPGMTGLWQVSGRSEIPFEEMCIMDIYYIENWSIRYDLEILLRTVPRVLFRSGAY